MTEQALGGGRGTRSVVRIGDTVHRKTGPWTPTVHAYLRHLRAAGFTAAPEVLGIDERGREVLRYIPGETWGDDTDPDDPVPDLVEPRRWPDATRSDAALAAIGRMLAALHRASAGFRPTDPVWQLYELPMREGEIVCHGDAGPWNTVYDDGLPIALIDWDGARPASPIEDLAIAAWNFVPLAADGDLATYGFTPPYRTARRLRLLCDAYGLGERARMVETLSLVKQRSAMLLRYWQPLRSGLAAAWLGALVRDLEWLDQHEDELRAALR